MTVLHRNNIIRRLWKLKLYVAYLLHFKQNSTIKRN